MGLPLFLVDAFADRPFAGNPAAVVLLEASAQADWMQAVAVELNQPATAFVTPDGDGFALRWFTRTAELALCGHGTLASAHVLWESGRLADGAAARFTAGANRLGAIQRNGWVELDFAAEIASAAEVPTGLTEALGVEAARVVRRNRYDYLVEVRDEATVRALRPDFGALARVETRGVIVTAPSSTDGVDFVSRFFAPRAGLDEDSVTGSAHACLGPYWSERLGRTELVGRQLSARGGTVRARVAGGRVHLAGLAVTVVRGELASRAGV
jgi:PhzF family phenazine biosynthesis protein